MERVEFMAKQREMLARGEIKEIVQPPANKLILSSTAFYQWNHLWSRVCKMMEQIHGEYKQRDRKGEDVSKYRLLGAGLNANQIPHRVMSDGRLCLHAFTYLDPREGFMNMESIEQARAEMSDYMFRMEYESYFPPDSEGFFRRSLMDAARQHCEFGPVIDPRKGCLYTMGVDPARTSDNFAVAIFEIEPGLQDIRLVRVMSWNQKNFPLMASEIRRLIRHYGIKYFKMDAGGGGTTIRDLLAEPPPGEKAILEDGFDEHLLLTGDRILGPLVQFSSYEWVHNANHNLLSLLQSRRMRIAAVPPVPGHCELWTPDIEQADFEMEQALIEWSSIIVTPLGSRLRWDTPSKNQRKDRYSAILIGADAALELLNRHNKPRSLTAGFWA